MNRQNICTITVMGLAAVFGGIACSANAPGNEPAPAVPSGIKVYDFEGATPGQSPDGFTIERTGEGGPAHWEVRKAEAASGTQVVAQLSDDDTSARYPLLLLNEVRTRDVDLSVKFKTISGKKDAAGGLIWRCRDVGNYYVVRANALEGNVVAYKTVNGMRSSIGIKGDPKSYGVKMDVPARQWNTLRVIARGNLFAVYFNGRKAFEVEDDTFTKAGKIGLWTKADSVTQFDDLAVASLDAIP